MDSSDYIIITLFIIIGIFTFVTLKQIDIFMPILKTCNDDFDVINKCKCVPCSWKSAEKYNGPNSCITINVTNER